MSSDIAVTARHMFLSYVNHVIAGEYIFDQKPQNLAPSEIPVQSIGQVNGYLIIDGHQLAMRAEHVYVEIDWEKLKKDLKDA